MENDLRKWMILVEAVEPTGSYYMHVSSGKNLKSILANGLHQEGYGNYSGYETALSGIYVTKEPKLIRDHINARMIENDYVLVIVKVGTIAIIDEDALDGWLHRALEMVAKQRGVSIDELGEDEETIDDVGKAMVPSFRASLGNPIKNPGRNLNSFLAEFCQTWFYERFVGGEGADGDWWMEAKERILKTFPKLSHVIYGTDYSIRLPTPVGYSGETHIVAIIHVKNNMPRVMFGETPPEAQAMIRNIV